MHKGCYPIHAHFGLGLSGILAFAQQCSLLQLCNRIVSTGSLLLDRERELRARELRVGLSRSQPGVTNVTSKTNHTVPAKCKETKAYSRYVFGREGEAGNGDTINVHQRRVSPPVFTSTTYWLKVIIPYSDRVM